MAGAALRKNAVRQRHAGRCYLAAWQATGRKDYLRVVRETLDYVLRDMTDPLGGFHSAEDADSEGQEGKFYVWTLDEVQAVLGPERAAAFAKVYDVSATAISRAIISCTFPSRSPSAPRSWAATPPALEEELAADRARPLEARAQRVRPGRDDKVLVSWNGLMIDALARAGAALDEPRYRMAAAAAADSCSRNSATSGGDCCTVGGQAGQAAARLAGGLSR